MPHGLHIRLPKNFVLEERLERYAGAIEPNPYAWCGMWAGMRSGGLAGLSRGSPRPGLRARVVYR